MSSKDTVKSVLDWPAFDMAASEKQKKLLGEMQRLTEMHMIACPPYQSVINKLYAPIENMDSLQDVPFIPVRLFKHQRLSSVPERDIIKTMTSSGTSGHKPSQIFLDKITAALQVKVLVKIVSSFLGSKRLPMLVIDCKATVADRKRFSARTAGILGFSIFSHNVEYALDEDMSLNEDRIKEFLSKHEGQDILLFGFTFIIWQNFLQELERRQLNLPLERGTLIHGGGWKKLVNEAVDNDEFKDRISKATGIQKVHNYYGMVEQTGSIFMECEEGYLHAPAWADILIRDPIDFKPLPIGEKGLVQLLSVIPHSYPGHCILSEDVGFIVGIDDCDCHRKGTYFKIEGRLEQAEVRGCSDSY
ncbi:MAG: hypothetical protein JKY84_10445 [Emcibacteraceae bacterium]|nr:hypothetical protein [Emcibacteraceae bacterium]